jgi:hypothetical protein
LATTFFRPDFFAAAFFFAVFLAGFLPARFFRTTFLLTMTTPRIADVGGVPWPEW